MTRYATYEETKRMEFGVTGDVRVIDGDYPTTVERLTNNEASAWVSLHLDAKGEWTGDWDYLDQDDARELGLTIPGSVEAALNLTA